MASNAGDTIALLSVTKKFVSKKNNNDHVWKYVGVILLTIQQTSMPLMARSARDRNTNELFITTVLYQMKILTTALMLRYVLRRTLSVTQWLSLMILVGGVVAVQTQYEPPRSYATDSAQSAILGVVAVITMCFTSAFAGVYMEKILKQSQVNVWMQNIRLALFGLLISTFFMLFKDYEKIQKYGFFIGFDALVWILTITNSAGGLLIAVVIKYADNISKAYAQSVSIVGAALGSWILFDFAPNIIFMLGTFLVILSIYIYSAFP